MGAWAGGVRNVRNGCLGGGGGGSVAIAGGLLGMGAWAGGGVGG
jgi:hypothetical protein